MDHYSELRSLTDKRQLTREKLDQSAKTLARAEQLADTHAADVPKKEAAVAAAQAENAHRLAALLAADDPATSLGVESPELSEAESLLAAARSRAAVSAKALESLREAHGKAQAELQAAETDAENAAIQIYVALVEAIAREATELRAKAEAARERVNYAMSIAVPHGRGDRAEARLYSALQSYVIKSAGAPPVPPERPSSDWGLPLHETAAARRAAAGIQPWRALFASLIHGNFKPDADTKAA